MKPQKYILYLGNYLDEDIVQRRGLSSLNVAGSNRMFRIAKAINSTKRKLIIVSPGTSLKAKLINKTLLHKNIIKRKNGTIIHFSNSFGVPYIGLFISTILYFISIINLCRKHNVDVIVIYNFNITLTVITFVLKFFTEIKIVHNVEDISVPKFKDWRKDSETNPVQQLVLFCCMNVISKLCDKTIIPSSKFVKSLPYAKSYMVISGCIDVEKNISLSLSQNIDGCPRILFAGKIAFEHGIQYLINSLEAYISSNYNPVSFQLDICGGGAKPKTEWLRMKLNEINSDNIKYHGFVSNDDYKNLLNKAHICIALQDANGRHAYYKTPSKVYEYLGSGKMVISTAVGDLPMLPDNIIRILDHKNTISLCEELINIINNPNIINKYRANAHKYAMMNFDSKIVGKRIIDFIFKE